MTTTLPTAPAIEREIQDNQARVAALQGERKQLALAAFSDPKVEARIAKIRAEEQALGARLETLHAAFAEVRRIERAAEAVEAERKRKIVEAEVRERIAALVPMARAIDDHMAAAAAMYRQMLDQTIEARRLFAAAGLEDMGSATVPIGRIFNMKSAVWYFFQDLGGDLSYVGNAHRSPLAPIIEGVAAAFEPNTPTSEQQGTAA